MSKTPKVFRTVMVPTGCFKRPARNPNVMSDRDYRALVESVRATGFVQPILARGAEPPRAPTPEDDAATVEDLLAAESVWRLSASSLEIVDGDHRYLAMVECGAAEVPAVVGPFTDREVALLQISMNRLRGELDLGAVAKVLDELAQAGTDDLHLSGYPQDEVDALLAAMKPDPEDLADMGAVGSGDDKPSAMGEPEKGWDLTIVFPSSRERAKVRKWLKRLGGGDMRAGIKAAMDEDEGGGEAEEDEGS